MKTLLVLLLSGLVFWSAPISAQEPPPEGLEPPAPGAEQPAPVLSPESAPKAPEGSKDATPVKESAPAAPTGIRPSTPLVPAETNSSTPVEPAPTPSSGKKRNIIPGLGIQVWDVDWRPIISLKSGAFFQYHPTDMTGGGSFSLIYHATRFLAVSADFRIGEGLDTDEDQYVHGVKMFGGSVIYYILGQSHNLSFQPFVRFSAGYAIYTDEEFQEDSESTKSRHYKENGVSAPGFKSVYTEQSVGVQFVLFSNSGNSTPGVSVDIDLGVVQDWEYGIGDSFFKFGFSLIFSY